MSDCFFEPCPDAPAEDPFATTTDEPTPTDEPREVDDGEMDKEDAPPKDEAMMEEEGDMEGEKLDIFLESQLTFLLTAGVGAFISAMDLFAWKWQTTVDDTTNSVTATGVVYHFLAETQYNSQTGSTQELWKWASMIWSYSSFAFTSVAFLTQLLSMFGILNEINIMVWIQGGMAMGLLMLITDIMVMVKWAQAKGKMKSGSGTALDTTAQYAAALIVGLETDMMWMAIEELSSFMMAVQHAGMWLIGQIHIMINAGVYTEEEAMEMWGDEDMKKEGKMEEHHEGHEGKDEDMEKEGDWEEMEKEDVEEDAEPESNEDFFGGFDLNARTALRKAAFGF